MTFAYFCVFISIFLPLFCAMYAKKTAGFTWDKNHNPRDFMNQLQGKAQRANAAQQNSYEVFPAFAAAVIIAHVSGGAAQATINFWAFVFVFSRIVFIYLYIQDKPVQRSFSWGLSFLSIIMLFIAAF